MELSVIDSPVNAITRKRRAVYSALFPYFDTEMLLRAMWIWEENYSTGNGSSLRQFISEITQGQQAAMVSKKLYNNLMASFLKPLDSLKNDPLEMMIAYRNGKLKIDNKTCNPVFMKTPKNIVFNFIMENLQSIINKESRYRASKVNEYFSANFFNLGLEMDKTKEILQWLESPGLFIGMKYTNKELSKLLHIYYIGICEFYGPQKADSFLNTVIGLAEQLPEARQFPPKNFL
jgi:hypothetical protein